MLKKKVTVKTLLATLFVAITMLGCLILGSHANYMLNWLGIIVYLYAIFTWKWEKSISLFTPYTIFYTFFLLFSYGQCVMWAFGIGLERGISTSVIVYGTSVIANEAQMITVKWYTCLCMLTFHFGAMFLAKNNSGHGHKKLTFEQVSQDRNLLYKCGCIVTAVVVPLAIYQRVIELFIARTYGYKSLYYGDLATQSGYIQILIYLFFPALLCLIIGSNFEKSTTRAAVIIFAIYAVLGMLAGDRGSWLYSTVILIWLFSHRKKIRLKTIVLLGVAGLSGLYILSLITKVRDSGLDTLSLNTLIDAFSAENLPVVDAFFEMGGSMGIITFFLIKGREIYPYGNTYITALLGAISSRVLSLFGIKQVLLSNWFSQEYLGLSWGTGFSMIGEAYVNGGYIGGLIYIFIIGVVIGRILSMCGNISDTDHDPIATFVAIAGLNIVVGFPRSAVYLVIKEFIYGILVILLLLWVMRWLQHGRVSVSKSRALR